MTGPLGVGSRFGPYLLKRLVGSGGMGSVYEAEDTVLQRSVALKLISATYAQDPDYRQRLQREARIAGRLQDPHVVPIHGAGEIDGQLYVDMRLINGVDLDTTVSRSGRLSPPRAVAIVSQIASALDDAHAAGVLHRDVKPANILLTANDFAYLVDFGIANAAAESKLTQAGNVLGTWAYMAPERFIGDTAAVSGSVDVYALACVLFEMLTGSPPFRGDPASVAGAHLTQPPPRPSAAGGIPAGLDEVIARGMAKQPAHRYPTAGALAAAARAALGWGTSPAPPPIGGPTAPWRSAPPTPAPRPATAWGSAPPTAVPGMPSGPSPYSWAPPFTAPPNSSLGERRKRWPLVVGAVVLVVALTVGVVVWKSAGGPAMPHTAAAGVDLSKLDVGKYGTQPRTLPGTGTEEEGRYLAAFHLAEAVVNPYDVDSEINDVSGSATPDPKLAATFISGNSTPVAEPVLQQYGMTTAYVLLGQSDHSPSSGISKTLSVLVTAFRNQDNASRAAAGIDDVDFAVDPNNQHATIPGYPQAHAHYDPVDSSMVATMANGYFAVSINYGEGGVTKRDDYFDSLTVKMQHIFDLAMPLMSGLTPIFDITFTQEPVDPDDMLRRAFVAGAQPTVSQTYGTVGPRAVITCEGPPVLTAGLFAAAGVDRCAFTLDSDLLRARDDTAASALLPKMVEADRPTRIDHDIAPPGGLSGTRCYEQKQSLWKDTPTRRFVCLMAFGRYLAFVGSSDENDVRQRAAAQYAILVNSA